MCGHADLRGGKVERRLDRDDDKNVFQATRSHRPVAMTQEQAGPYPNQSHDTARRPDQLLSAVQAKHAQEQNTDARPQTGEQIANAKTNLANHPL